MSEKIIIEATKHYGLRYQAKFSEECSVEIPKGANWCAVFAGFVISRSSNISLPEHPQVARAYLHIGNPVETPDFGDVAIYWRSSRSSWKGHINFFLRETKDSIWAIGGNQNGMVCVQEYSKERLLGFRRIT